MMCTMRALSAPKRSASIDTLDALGKAATMTRVVSAEADKATPNCIKAKPKASQDQIQLLMQVEKLLVVVETNQGSCFLMVVV